MRDDKDYELNGEIIVTEAMIYAGELAIDDQYDWAATTGGTSMYLTALVRLVLEACLSNKGIHFQTSNDEGH